MTREHDGASPRPDLSVILVSWNCRELVMTAIRRVLERSGGLRLEVLLVDNASSDGTVQAVRERYPGVRVVASRENVGFPRANNLALVEATGRHVLFLNPDTEVGEGTLERCVAELDGDPELGAVGCRLLLPDGRTQVEGARRHYRLLDLLWEGLYLHMLFPRSRLFAGQVMGEWDHAGTREVEALAGAFMMVRREALLEAGGMPDQVFMYHEDLALCLRLEEMGWRIRYLGDVTTVHVSGGAVRSSSSPLELLEGEVRVRLIRERSGWWAGVAARGLFGIRQVLRLFFALLTRPVPFLRRRYPQVSDVGKQATLLAWTIWPGVVERRLRRSGVPRDQRPRLLVVAPTPPPVHGVSVYTRMLLSSMELRTRFRVDHVELADRRDLDNLGKLDLRNVWLGLRHAAEVLAAAWTRRPDLCYIALSQNRLAFLRDALLMAAARSSGARVVAHVHGGYLGTFYGEASGTMRAFMRAAMRLVHRGWVLGEGFRDLFDGLLPDHRVRVVPNGVPGPEDPSRAPADVPGDAPFTVLYLGQVGATKGVDDLLDAVERLAGEDRTVRCLVAGGFLTRADEERLAPRLDSLHARGLVEPLGVVGGEEKERAFARAHALALPSRGFPEGQPLVILEAMVRGLPVVATPGAAIRDMVVDGETGFLVPEGDPAALAAALARLADAPDLRARLGCGGRKRHAALFTRERCLERVAEELEHALG